MIAEISLAQECVTSHSSCVLTTQPGRVLITNKLTFNHIGLTLILNIVIISFKIIVGITIEPSPRYRDEMKGKSRITLNCIIYQIYEVAVL